MPVCFFDRNYEKKYNCEYEVVDEEIRIFVDYDITNEIESVNKGIVFSSNTDFKERDILIVDYANKTNYLIKDAWYAGYTATWGTPDGGMTTIFKSSKYLHSKDYESLSKLEKDFKVSSIKIYSNLVNELIGRPSVCIENSKEEVLIRLKRETAIQNKEFEKNDINIKQILISDTWNAFDGSKENKININISGYIEIVLNEEVDFQDTYEYILELIIFLQLLYPNKIEINKMNIKVQEKYFEFYIPIRNVQCKDKMIAKSVEEDILSYLEKCYHFIHYRNNKNSIRNISNIILNTNRNLEDNFLILYKFIECYYKEQGKKSFILHAIENNYKEKLDYEKEDLVAEIISLRNHYVHSGYHIKNECLEIQYKKVKNKITKKLEKNPKDYIAENINFNWIYKRTEILYKIVIDIIFTNMLGYRKYKFNKQFGE